VQSTIICQSKIDELELTPMDDQHEKEIAVQKFLLEAAHFFYNFSDCEWEPIQEYMKIKRSESKVHNM
jgi:hypothetical protein